MAFFPTRSTSMTMILWYFNPGLRLQRLYGYVAAISLHRRMADFKVRRPVFACSFAVDLLLIYISSTLFTKEIQQQNDEKNRESERQVFSLPICCYNDLWIQLHLYKQNNRPKTQPSEPMLLLFELNGDSKHFKQDTITTNVFTRKWFRLLIWNWSWSWNWKIQSLWV